MSSCTWQVLVVEVSDENIDVIIQLLETLTEFAQV